MDYFDFMQQVTRKHAQNYKGVSVEECLDLARRLRDQPYSYDRHGETEFIVDLQDLCDKLALLAEQDNV